MLHWIIGVSILIYIIILIVGAIVVWRAQVEFGFALGSWLTAAFVAGWFVFISANLAYGLIRTANSDSNGHAAMQTSLVIDCSGSNFARSVELDCRNVRTGQNFTCTAFYPIATSFAPTCNAGLRSTGSGYVTDDGTQVFCQTAAFESTGTAWMTCQEFRNRG